MDAKFLEGLPCDKTDCRLERHGNVLIAHEFTPALFDREGKEVQPVQSHDEIAHEVACQTCGKTFRQTVKNGVVGSWTEYTPPPPPEPKAEATETADDVKVAETAP